MKIIEWPVADAKRAERAVQQRNMAKEAKWQRQAEIAKNAGEDLPDRPSDFEPPVCPEFHISGERLFELQGAEGMSRAQVTQSLQDYVRRHPRAPLPSAVDAEDEGW